VTRLDPAALARAQWHKSSYSGGGNQCVEVAHIGAAVAVRDSKDRDGCHLTFGSGEWKEFLDGIKHGSYGQ
jgi:hypothetical protein